MNVPWIIVVCCNSSEVGDCRLREEKDLDRLLDGAERSLLQFRWSVTQL